MPLRHVMADISIIIPTYNRLWGLPKAVESCLSSGCAVEVIVVDDGSTDGTWQWLQARSDVVSVRTENWGKDWAVDDQVGTVLYKDRAIRVARRIEAGQVDINGAPFNSNAPFGGYKQSGHGRENGKYGLEEFLEFKAMQFKPAEK